MKINILLRRPKKYKEGLNKLIQKDFSLFAKEQFLQLTKKNIRVPVKLFQL